MTVRVLVIAVLLLGLLALAAWRRRRDRSDAGRGAAGLGRLPHDLRSAAPTWIVLTTPTCASCRTAAALLGAHRPADQVRTVDITDRPELAARYEVRRAPTTLLATSEGVVTERFVGLDQLVDHLGA